MNVFKIASTAGLLVALLPGVALAADPPSKLDTLIQNLYTNVLDPLFFLLFAAAIIVFIWGVSGMVRNYADETERLEGRRSIWWGLLGILIMTGVLGIMCIVSNTLGVTGVVPYC